MSFLSDKDKVNNLIDNILDSYYKEELIPNGNKFKYYTSHNLDLDTEDVYTILSDYNLIVLKTKLDLDNVEIILFILRIILTDNYSYFEPNEFIYAYESHIDKLSDEDVKMFKNYEFNSKSSKLWKEALLIMQKFDTEARKFDKAPSIDRERLPSPLRHFPQEILSITSIRTNLRITSEGIKKIYTDIYSLDK